MRLKRYDALYKAIRTIPMPGSTRLRLTRLVLERHYDAEVREVSRQAKAAGLDHGARHAKLEDLHVNWRYDFHLHEDEERRHHSRQLLAKARSMRLVVPQMHVEGKLASDYEVSSLTEIVHLTLQGENKVRAAIREEQKYRWEVRLRLIPFITALTGLVGTVAGLVAVWGKGHP